MALVAYRHVLRSAKVAFQGDIRLLSAARAEAASKFRTHRVLDPSSPEAEQKVQEAEQVAVILRQNIVQGRKTDGDEQDQRYSIRIHEQTEKHDNNDRSMRGSGGLLDSGGTSGCGSPVRGQKLHQKSRIDQVQASKLN